MNILITGGAGFIGSSLVEILLKEGQFKIYCLDNFDAFYDKKIKQKNIQNFFNNKNFNFIEKDILHISSLEINEKIDCIVHLAAKAGVRPSIENAESYFDVNVNGTLKVLEYAKRKNIKKVIFASSSSVYGVNKNIPWKTVELDLQPISPYASSKIAAEKIGFTYSYLFDIKFIALRFFTVYGPKQRPDLAISKFISKIYNNETIQIYGDGSTSRDYTYIDDIIEGIYKAIQYNPVNHFEVFNLGNSKTIKLIDLVNTIGNVIDKLPEIEYQDEQEGDVPLTFSDITNSQIKLGYNPKTSIKEGIEKQFKYYLNQI
jgi:UDP-glucuronate 4-epimerase